MKTKTLITAFLLILLLVTACEKPEIPEEKFPQEISFTEFSLRGDACQWVSFESNKVIVINSTEELRNFLVCVNDGRFFQIDFSKYSFLLARGSAESAVFYIDVDFSKQASKKYALNLKIHIDVSMAAQTWMIAGITPKISSGANIVLNTQELQDTRCTEVDLLGTRWKLMGIVDTETGALTAPRASIQNDFTISFEPVTINQPPFPPREFLFTARIGTRTTWGSYEFDYNTCTYPFIRSFMSSGQHEPGFQWLIDFAFRHVRFFTLRNTQPRILLLHCDNFYGAYYLLKYKEIENE